MLLVRYQMSNRTPSMGEKPNQGKEGIIAEPDYQEITSYGSLFCVFL